MKKVILIDGNNLLFRSYYATAYSGNILRNSKGFPTNALYGFINMLNKIIKEESPSYIMIAFDKGKTFRHEKYKEYKDGRKTTPDELKLQFPVAKQIAKAMGISCFEIDNYEADDIIGTFAKEVDLNDEFTSTIISSDKDLLQLISKDNEVKLLKQSDYIRLNEEAFFDLYGFTPDKMIDLKAIMGDSSDNIPGVKGIGEKGAIKLVKEYGTLENIYNNIDKITGKTKEKLINDKESAFFSKELVTIYKDVPINKDLNKIKYSGPTKDLESLLKEYEFFSLLKKIELTKEEKELSYKIVNEITLDTDSTIYIETEGNYHDKKLLGISITNDKGNFFIKKGNINNIKINKDVTLYTYDLKKLLVIFKYYDIDINNKIYDLMIEAYILNYQIKEDISHLMNIKGYDAITVQESLKKGEEIFISNMIEKSSFIYENKIVFYEELIRKDFLSLYLDIELPLCYVLANMELNGVMIDKEFLNKMKQEVEEKIKVLEDNIYSLSKRNDYNINSPKQLGTVLFEELNIPYPKKLKKGTNYSTSADILEKLKDHEIVNKILEYRSLTKLYSNYIVGLIDYIKEDGKIHPIFTQTLTRTGRLSCMSPNLQNIPAREEYGKLIRKAFIPSYEKILTSDYSQIELRVFAHMSNATNMIEAFNNNLDIHTKTAIDIYNVDKENVTSSMRRTAKAVNFGIIYGISSFGLSEDLGINVKDAKNFIDNYLKTFPGIKDYMESITENAKKEGIVKNIFGRERIIEELKSSNFMVRKMGERMALNTPIQGTAADILKIAMIKINNKFKEKNLKSKMIIQVHDELLFDCKNDEITKVKEIVKEEMENAYKLSVPLKTEIGVGTSWYDAK